MALLSYLSQTLITFFSVMFPCNLQIGSPLFDSSHLGGLPSDTQLVDVQMPAEHENITFNVGLSIGLYKP